MTQPQHPPTPWRLEDNLLMDANGQIIGAHPGARNYVVRAVNSHAALVDALQRIGDLNEEELQRAGLHALRAIARAALREAGEEENT